MKAKNVLVSVKPENRKTIIQIIDDGVGFIKEESENARNTSKTDKGLGLNSMQYRANQIGASFVIKSNKPCGTCVQLSLSNKLLEDKDEE